MRTIETYEDLQCWKISVELCELVYTLCEKAKLPTDDELACRWYVASLHVSGKIAFAYGPEDIDWFKKWIPLAQKYCMETVFWAGVAKNKGLISKKDYELVVSYAKSIIKKITSIIRYVNVYGHQEKYKWKVLFKDITAD